MMDYGLITPTQKCKLDCLLLFALIKKCHLIINML